jgi:hypothetical protein
MHINLEKLENMKNFKYYLIFMLSMTLSYAYIESLISSFMEDSL